MTEAEETLSSETVFEGRRITVKVRHIRLADGVEGVREVVLGPDAVVVVAVDDDAHVLLVRQYRSAPGVELLELPAGGIEPGEAPLAAAQRELREETGHAAAQLRALGSFHTSPGILGERMYAFLATGLSESPLSPDEDERIALERMPFTEALEVARGGGFQDGKTLASLLMAERPVLGNAG